MARPTLDRTRLAAAPPTAQVSDRVWIAYALAGILLVIGIPAAVAVGASWVRFSEATKAGKPTPNWVRSEAVHATTNDGDSVKAQVTIDATDGHTRAVLEANRTQVALLLQISLGAHDRTSIQGAKGMQRLSKDLRRRLNEFLDGHNAPPVREVIIQDLFSARCDTPRGHQPIRR
ncbi:MAG: hypothetical protein Q7T97_06205 [Burkholderiaceae bacterium]|nr:hypothetical protein [Burkholderiaceae bacterium]